MIIFGTDQMDKFHEILLVQGIFHPRLQSYGSVDSDKNNWNLSCEDGHLG